MKMGPTRGARRGVGRAQAPEWQAWKASLPLFPRRTFPACPVNRIFFTPWGGLRLARQELLAKQRDMQDTIRQRGDFCFDWLKKRGVYSFPTGQLGEHKRGGRLPWKDTFPGGRG